LNPISENLRFQSANPEASGARKKNTLTLEKMRLGEEETWRAEKGSQKLFVVYGLLSKKEVYRQIHRPFFG